jgi:hypothetical protein
VRCPILKARCPIISAMNFLGAENKRTGKYRLHPAKAYYCKRFVHHVFQKHRLMGDYYREIAKKAPRKPGLRHPLNPM